MYRQDIADELELKFETLDDLDNAFAAVKERLIPGFEKAGLEYVVEIYEGACSYEGAKEYGDKALAAGCDEVVGIGGGKIMDFAKAVGESAGLGVVNIPTSMSTCAPFTTMSVMCMRSMQSWLIWM